jgi:SAM-dependent methyltransferase
MSDGGALFDHYVAGYEQALSAAIGVSGETREYFAEGRVAWLGRCLERMGFAPREVVDFGCGDGATAPILLAHLRAECAVGIDVSLKSLELARKNHASSQIRFESLAEFQPNANVDLAYCNGVFHHIAPDARAAAIKVVNASLRPGGLFALWENNPWSPAARYVMSRCEFDRDAKLLTPRAARAMLREGGFEIVRTDFRFLFPKALRAFRKIEDLVYRLPLGTQYQILACKPR